MDDEIEEPSDKKKGFFKRLVSGLTKTRDNIVAGFDSIFRGYDVIDEDIPFYQLVTHGAFIMYSEPLNEWGSLDGAVLRLKAADVPHPSHARYAWTDYGTVNLFGENGLPLEPFRM